MFEDDVKPEVEIKEDPETAVVEGEDTLTVDLDKPAGTPKAEDKPKPEPKKQDMDARRIHDLVGFQVRQQVKPIEKKLDELVAYLGEMRKGATPAQAEQIDEQLDEIDKLAQKDWKAAVKKLALEEAQRHLQETIQFRGQQETEMLRQQVVEKSRNFVLSQYPQLADESSDERKVFNQVWNENPTLWNNPEGHRLAMYEMEERIRAMGRTPKRVKYEVDKEVKRQLRANISQVSGNGGPSSNKYVLTKEQQEVCDQLGIKYEDYAKTARALENKEDITI